MTLIEIARMIRLAWEALAQPSPSRYLLHLEQENAILATEAAMLRLKLEGALTAKPEPVPIKRALPKMAVPAPSSWEQYLHAEMLRQDQEDQLTTSKELHNGVPS